MGGSAYLGGRDIAPDRMGKMRRLTLSALLAIFGLTLSGCQPLPSYSYILRVTVDTPDGPVQGESVIKVTAYRQPRFLPDVSPLVVDAHGEAVIIPTKRKSLLLLLGNSHGTAFADNIALESFGFPVEPQRYGPHVEAFKRSRDWIKVPKKYYTSMASFENNNDPSTISVFNPDDIRGRLGNGYSIISIDVKNTRGNPTRKLYEVLPWIDKFKHLYDQPRSWSSVGISRDYLTRK